jgi:hypothetical protein
MTLKKGFYAAIADGVCGITGGGLGPLSPQERKRLLKKLRRHKDCPEGWKNTNPKKQNSILKSLHNAIT